MKIAKTIKYLIVLIILLLVSCLLFACFTGKDDKGEGSAYDLSKLTLVAVGGSDFTYDGTEKRITINVNDNRDSQNPKRIASIAPNENHPDLEVIYADNVNAGTATAC